MPPRVRFPGDPQVKETGTGQPLANPLGTAVHAVTEERLTKEDQDYNAKVGSDEEQVVYERENIGLRTGIPMEQNQRIAELEKEIDTERVVPLIFQRELILQDKGLLHRWGPGVHLVPVSIAGETPMQMHWWLKHNKVRRAGKPQDRPVEDEAAA